jgi:LysM repeat protein
MVRLTRWHWLVCILTYVLSSLPLTGAIAQAPDTRPAVDWGQDGSLAYRLRAGESLQEVARLFRIPLEELMQVNRITDPTRLAIGQPLQVPNVFARQVIQFQKERDQLAEEKEQLVKESGEQQQAAAAMRLQLRTAEAANTALTQQLAVARRWRGGALTLAVLLLGVGGWSLKLKGAQMSRDRKLAVVLEENTALGLVREKYRQTAAQLELRYQKLYSARAAAAPQFLTEGAALLAQTFAQGCTQLESLLAQIRAERAREILLFQKGQPPAALFLHPLRGLLAGSRSPSPEVE